MLALISRSSVVLAIVGGIPVCVILLMAIWVRPRRATAAWALVSLLIVAGLAGGVAAAFAEKGKARGVVAAEAPPPAPASNSSPQATCSPNGAALVESVHNIHYGATCLAAPANTPFTIAFDNQDALITHNIHIFASNPDTDPGAASLFAGDLVTGVATKTYQVGALPAGTYFFHCDVHPTQMFGVFIVAAG